ncbi:MAG: DUF1707 SHOCT-like domain-containing protein [Acidimicrobiales bacterium]
MGEAGGAAGAGGGDAGAARDAAGAGGGDAGAARDAGAVGDPGTAGGPGSAGGRDELRASDADRERAAEILRQHCTAGRLDLDEYGERVGRVYAARTLPELYSVSSDLPHPDAVTPVAGWPGPGNPAVPGWASWARSVRPLSGGSPLRWAGVGFVVAVAALLVSVYGPLSWAVWVFWVFLAVFVVSGGATLVGWLLAGRK